MGNCWPWQDFQRGSSEELDTNSEDRRRIGAKKPEDSSDSPTLSGPETGPSKELDTSSEDPRRTGAENPRDSSDSPTLNDPETGLIDLPEVDSLADLFEKYLDVCEEPKDFGQLREVVDRLQCLFHEMGLKKEIKEKRYRKELEAKCGTDLTFLILGQDLTDTTPAAQMIKDTKPMPPPKLFVEECYKDQVEEINWESVICPEIVYHQRKYGGAILLIAGTFTLPVDTTKNGWQECLTDAVHVILKDIHILILGEPYGLEEDLAYDFALVAKQAGVDTSAFSVSEETEQSVKTARGMFVLLSCPTVEHLNRSLREYLIDRPASNIGIYYSGHSHSNGNWWLGEDNFYSGGDLKQLMSDVQQHRTINVTIVVLINSCYGLKFVEDALIDNEDSLKLFNVFIQSHIYNLKQQHRDGDPILKDKDIAECNISVSGLHDPRDETHSECVSDNTNEANSIVFTKIMFAMYKRPLAYREFLRGREFPEFFAGVANFRLIPFSLESLDARGVLCECFGVSTPDDKAKENMLLKRNIKLPILVRNLTSPLARAVQPTIYAFPAGNGDSTLIRYDGINILIDGGIYSTRPCFWPVVSRLPAGEKLDVVILTHQDIDHLNGIKALINRAPDDFIIGALYCLDPPPHDTKLSSKATYGGTDVWNKAVERKVAKKLQPCYIPFKDRPDITLRILAPNESDACRARTWMKSKPRLLTAPNEASAVVYLGIEKGDRTYRALFTGDAPSRTVVKAIKNSRQLSEPADLSFDYIDVPHHGSKNNDPNHLFKSVKKCDVAVISTNGDRHGHPDKVTLTDLGSHMRTGKIGKVGFTYKKHQGKNICEPSDQGNGMLRYEGLGDLQANRVHAADNTFGVKPSKSCLKIVLDHQGSSITSEVMSTTDSVTD